MTAPSRLYMLRAKLHRWPGAILCSRGELRMAHGMMAPLPRRELMMAFGVDGAVGQDCAC